MPRPTPPPDRSPARPAPPATGPLLAGLVLAAGAGRRFGGPKALARTSDGTPWLHLAVAALRDGGCERVLVALGAGALDALPLLPPGAEPVLVPGWREGVAAGLRRGLAAAVPDRAADDGRGPDAVVVVTVDTPSLPAAAVRRVAASAGPRPAGALVQAVHGSRPGHPVLIGRDHVAPVLATVAGDVGARPYLLAHGATPVECGDLWDGADVDRPAPTTTPTTTPPDQPRRS